MTRSLSLLMTGLALLGTLACYQDVREEPAAETAQTPTAEGFEQAEEAAQTAYMAAESLEEKLSIIRGFLARYPDTEDTAEVLGLIGNDALAAEKPDVAFELAEEVLGAVEDPDNRFQVRLKLADLYAKAGRKDQLRSLAAELGRERELGYRDHYALIAAALAAEDWELAVEHSEASLAFATPAQYKEDSPEVSDAEAELYGTRRVAHSLAHKGWAQFQMGRQEEAFASFREAERSTDYSVLGVDSTPLSSYRGRALLAHGQPEKAMEVLATEAVFGADAAAREAYREAYAACHGGEDGVEEHLWKMRQRQARELPDFSLPNYEGETVSLSELRGDVVLLAFWFPT